MLVGRSRGIDDIRKYGSGNIGASNVLRIIGVKAGLFVWVMDALKGLAPLLLARYALGLAGWWVAAVALAALLGHCFSPYLRLTGGRGVSTSLGVLIGLDWRAGLVAFALWILVVAISRYISLGSMIATASSGLVLHLFGGSAPFVWTCLAIALVVILRHIPNIKRLLAGTERKIGQREQIESPSESAT